MVLPYFTALVFGTMSPLLNLTQYKDHYDNTHIPLVKSLTGANFPAVHTRHYVGGNAAFVNASWPVDWDSMAVMSFRDQTHALTFLGIISAPGAKEAIERDEEEFMAHKPRMVVVGTDGSVSWP
ncbi:hypothetical protein CC86DRAFT_107783 [Ophiobolus disseminans]|uniref:EthD domain-containing protein n=1 Tax=Ophiobolus disseminans TaxID=1469910 RepID=A0A6A6ZJW9_9PLEO|nr:hypothetical protein CC86DRAFT_107783 [Ophiobolus disseminans]